MCSQNMNKSENIHTIYTLHFFPLPSRGHVWLLLANDATRRNISKAHPRKIERDANCEGLSACKRQSKSLNDVSSGGSFHDEGAYLPALLSNFDNFISREKTPRYESGSRKSSVNPIVAGELGKPKGSNVKTCRNFLRKFRKSENFCPNVMKKFHS